MTGDARSGARGARVELRREVRAEYEGRINRVVDYVQAHLGEPLRLEPLARIACFSPFHFHRIFAAMMGETLSQFVARLRLEKAAALLQHNPALSVTEVALDCGFSSQATLARAFRGRFGMTAGEWRRSRLGDDRKPGNEDRKPGNEDRKPGVELAVSPGYRDPRTFTLSWRLEMRMNGEQELQAEVVIEELPEMPVAYVRHVGPYKGDAKLFEGLWNRLCTWAGPRGLLGPQTQMFCMYQDDPEITDEEKLRVSVCITVPPDTEVGGDIGKLVIPGGTYAVARFEIDSDQYQAAWSAVYGGWLPESGYQPDDRPALERFHGGPGDHPEGKHCVDICVPVKPL